MIIFTIFFGRIAGINTDGIPYPIFSYTGLLFWQFFSTALSNSSNSFVTNQAILQKIYFPRVIMAIAATLVSFVDFIFASIVFVGLMIFYHYSPSLIGLLLVIPALLITFITSAGLGLFLSTLNVKYRDVRYALPFFIQILLFLTPVIYPITLVSKNYQWLLALNPMTGVIETMRSGLLNTGNIDWGILGISIMGAFGLFIIGYLYFYNNEKDFGDVI